MSGLPMPRDLEVPVGELVRELAEHLGTRATVELCVDLLRGAERTTYSEELPYLTGLAFDEGAPALDRTRWKDHWVRTWGARGLLYVWDGAASPAVVAGLGDEHWRPAEMCLKVATRHEIGEAGPGAAVLAVRGSLPRVRVQALRTLGAVGDTEHVDLVSELLDDPDLVVRRQAARSLTLLGRRLDVEVGEV